MLKVISGWQRPDEDALTMTHAFKCVDEIIFLAVKSLVRNILQRVAELRPPMDGRPPALFT